MTRCTPGAAWRGRPGQSGALILRSVIRDRDRILGQQHPETLDSRPRYWLGRALRGQGRHREAEAVLSELVKNQVKALGNDHPAAAATRAALDRSPPP